MRWIDEIVRIFVGLLFVFSGLVKVNDPMGTAIKLEEYFDVFASDFASFFHYFVPYSLTFAVIFVVLEVVLGVALLMKYRMKLTSWLLLLLIVFFTFLTFYSAAFDKVTDCGCFGDAIPLSPWQSFGKDIILLVLSIYILFRLKEYKKVLPQVTGDIVMGVVVLLNFGLAIYALEHLPYIDFRYYSVGSDVPKLMQSSAPLKYQYIMEKDGELYEMDQYPTDTTYHFKDMRLLNPEAQPKITDYNIWNEEGDHTEDSFTGSKLLIIIPDVSHARIKKIAAINQLTVELKNDLDIWVITSNDESTYENFRHEYQIPLPYYYVDGTVAKAMIRANPGLLLMNNGVVLGKWHNNDLPNAGEIRDLISS
jgi:uncharacterized membrane protein YphA (DoxX/SURF4 family)